MASSALRVKEHQELYESVRIMSRAVRDFGDNELRKAMVKASREAAAVAVPYVKKRVPVATGTLQRNIKRRGTKTIPKLVAGTKTRGGPYAWFVHSGHKVRGSSGRRVEAKPFMREGISEAYPKVLDKYREGQREAAKIFNDKVTRRAYNLRKNKGIKPKKVSIA